MRKLRSSATPNFWVLLIDRHPRDMEESHPSCSGRLGHLGLRRDFVHVLVVYYLLFLFLTVSGKGYNSVGSPDHEECAACIPWTGAQKYDVTDGTSGWSSGATNIVLMGIFMESKRLSKNTKLDSYESVSGCHDPLSIISILWLVSFEAREGFVRMAVAVVLDLLRISRESFRQDPMSPRLPSGTTGTRPSCPSEDMGLGEGGGGCRGKPSNKWPAVDIRCH